VTYSGEYVLQIFDSFAGNLPLLLIAICECVGVCYCYGIKRYVQQTLSTVSWLTLISIAVCHWNFYEFCVCEGNIPLKWRSFLWISLELAVVRAYHRYVKICLPTRSQPHGVKLKTVNLVHYPVVALYAVKFCLPEPHYANCTTVDHIYIAI